MGSPPHLHHLCVCVCVVCVCVCGVCGGVVWVCGCVSVHECVYVWSVWVWVGVCVVVIVCVWWVGMWVWAECECCMSFMCVRMCAVCECVCMICVHVRVYRRH